MGKMEIVKTEEQLYDIDLMEVFAPIEDGRPPLVRFSCTDNKTELFAAINGAGESITTIFGDLIEVTSIIITSADVPIDRNHPDDGTINKPCVNFYTPEGQHYASISNGVVRATRNMLGMGLLPSSDNPIQIVFKQIRTAKGTAHTFDIVDGME